jgi:hypothetical protein
MKIEKKKKKEPGSRILSAEEFFDRLMAEGKMPATAEEFMGLYRQEINRRSRMTINPVTGAVEYASLDEAVWDLTDMLVLQEAIRRDMERTGADRRDPGIYRSILGVIEALRDPEWVWEVVLQPNVRDDGRVVFEFSGAKAFLAEVGRGGQQ